MKTHYVILVLFLAAAVTLMPAHAQTPAERNACRPDAVRLCSSVLWGGILMTASCLISHRPQLSPRCRAVLASHGL